MPTSHGWSELPPLDDEGRPHTRGRWWVLDAPTRHSSTVNECVGGPSTERGEVSVPVTAVSRSAPLVVQPAGEERES
jgi:hypothetical protein